MAESANNRLSTGFAVADESPGLLLWQVSNRWQAAQRAVLAPIGLTHVQFVLLASLTWLTASADVTQRDLAEHAATDPMMTSQVVRTLEKKGLVLRERHPDDGRAMLLKPTDTGVALANRAVVVVEGCDREFFAGLGDQAPGFVAALRRLRQR